MGELTEEVAMQTDEDDTDRTVDDSDRLVVWVHPESFGTGIDEAVEASQSPDSRALAVVASSSNHSNTQTTSGGVLTGGTGDDRSAPRSDASDEVTDPRFDDALASRFDTVVRDYSKEGRVPFASVPDTDDPSLIVERARSDLAERDLSPSQIPEDPDQPIECIGDEAIEQHDEIQVCGGNAEERGCLAQFTRRLAERVNDQRVVVDPEYLYSRSLTDLMNAQMQGEDSTPDPVSEWNEEDRKAVLDTYRTIGEEPGAQITVSADGAQNPTPPDQSFDPMSE